MLAIIGAILSGAVKGLMAFFLPSKDEKLGRAEINSAILTKEFQDVQKAQAAITAVRNGNVVQLRDPNARSD